MAMLLPGKPGSRAQSHILYCLFNPCANLKLIQNENFKYYLWNYLLHFQIASLPLENVQGHVSPRSGSGPLILLSHQFHTIYSAVSAPYPPPKFYNSSQNYNFFVLEIILIEINYFIFTVFFFFVEQISKIIFGNQR